VLTIQRLLARARLDEPAPTLRSAAERAASGDEDWERWLVEYDRGEALIVRLEVMVEAADGDREVVQARNRGVFIEVDVHPPKVERQIAQIATKDFPSFAKELSGRGHSVDVHELSEMYVHVELDGELRRVLVQSASRRPLVHRELPNADARLSETDRSD
jgi:hypothetical protein